MRVLHITEASAAGVLHSVATACNAQAACSSLYSKVAFIYIPREGSPPLPQLRHMFSSSVDVISLAQKVTRLNYLKLLRAVLQRASDYDVIHVHSSKAGFFCRVFLSSEVLKKCVYTAHGLSFSHGQSPVMLPVFKVLEGIALARVPRVISVSDSEAISWASIGHTNSQVVYNSVRVEPMDCLLPKGNKHTALKVVHVGRICEGKNPGLFSEVIERLNAELEISAIWIGDGDRSLITSRKVQVTGWLDSAQVARELNSADLMLFTTTGEGMPMSILEAQAGALPVLASDVVGVNSLIRHKENGYLAGNVEEFVSGALDLLADSQIRSKVVGCAFDEVNEKYNIRDYAERFFHAYKSLHLVP